MTRTSPTSRTRAGLFALALLMGLFCTRSAHAAEAVVVPATPSVARVALGRAPERLVGVLPWSGQRGRPLWTVRARDKDLPPPPRPPADPPRPAPRWTEGDRVRRLIAGSMLLFLAPAPMFGGAALLYFSQLFVGPPLGVAGGVLFGVGTGLIIGAIRMLAEARRIGRWLREERRHRLSTRGGMLELRF